jgi:hypothetical protein
VNKITQVATKQYDVIWVPDSPASNVVRVRDCVLVQAGR